MKPMFALSERSKQRREGVDHRLIEISDRAIEITVFDFGIPADGGVRTAQRQSELFKRGKSKADGYKNKSNHQPAEDGYGKALDFYAYVDGKASWDLYHLAMVAAAFLQAASELGYELEWGGLWKNFRDMPHVQIID